MKHHNKYINPVGLKKILLDKAIETRITQNAPKLPQEHIKAITAYIGTKHKMLGLGTELQRQLAKANYNLPSDPHNDLPAFDLLYKRSKVFEMKNASLLMVDVNYKKLDKQHLYKHMIGWVDHVDNWAHSDYLSKFYTRFLEEEKLKNEFLTVLKKWNSDKNLWKRRQSLVALFYYARTKKTHPTFNTVKNLIETLLNDEEYFVQKAVGWCLRESYNVYPELTYKFAMNNFDKISSTAFSAACEKMTEKEKNTLKLKRKLHRKIKK